MSNYADAEYQRKRRKAIKDGTWKPKQKGGVGTIKDKKEYLELPKRLTKLQQLMVGPIWELADNFEAAGGVRRNMHNLVQHTDLKVATRVIPFVCPEKKVAQFLVKAWICEGVEDE